MYVYVSGAKSTKHKGTDGEPSPSPRKSPKRSSSRSASRSSSRDAFPSEASTPSRPVSDRPELTGQRLSESPKSSGRKKREPRRSRTSVDRELEPSVSSVKSESRPDSAVSKKSINRESLQNGASDEPMDITDSQKENIQNGQNNSELVTLSSSPRTPSKFLEDSKVLAPLTPLEVDDTCISTRVPQATSTPATNGFLANGHAAPLSKSHIVIHRNILSKVSIITHN